MQSTQRIVQNPTALAVAVIAILLVLIDIAATIRSHHTDREADEQVKAENIKQNGWLVGSWKNLVYSFAPE